MLVAAGARFHMHHHVGGDDGADRALDGVARGVGLLEAGGARDADGNLPEKLLPATPSAPTASSVPSHAIPNLNPIHEAVIPTNTTSVLHTSVEKCSASASSASLGYFLATRLSARDLTKSIPIARTRIRMAVRLGRISVE